MYIYIYIYKIYVSAIYLHIYHTPIDLKYMYCIFPDGSMVKNPPTMKETQEMRVQSLGQEDSLEEEMALQ